MLTHDSCPHNDGALQDELRTRLEKSLENVWVENLFLYQRDDLTIFWQIGVQEKQTEEWSQISETLKVILFLIKLA